MITNIRLMLRYMDWYRNGSNNWDWLNLSWIL